MKLAAALLLSGCSWLGVLADRGQDPPRCSTSYVGLISDGFFVGLGAALVGMGAERVAGGDDIDDAVGEGLMITSIVVHRCRRERARMTP
jgi:hypothetical protein